MLLAVPISSIWMHLGFFGGAVTSNTCQHLRAHLYRDMDAFEVGSVALSYHLEQLVRFFRALQTGVHPKNRFISAITSSN